MAKVDARLAQGAAGKWLGKRVVTELQPTGDYWLAEAYHQQYLVSDGGVMGFGGVEGHNGMGFGGKGCKQDLESTMDLMAWVGV
jgi:hypothetical protein